MTDKFENIESEEIKLNKNGEVELSDDLADAVAGGFDPEADDELEDTNVHCTVTNNGCRVQQ